MFPALLLLVSATSTSVVVISGSIGYGPGLSKPSRLNLLEQKFGTVDGETCTVRALCKVAYNGRHDR